MTSVWTEPERWFAELEAIEGQSPWPGPRPLDDEDFDKALVGRDNDLKALTDALRACKLVHLTGVSGVGKSSLLMAGIVPQLRKNQYTVGLCRDWDNFADKDFDVFLAEAIHRRMDPEEQKRFSNNTDIFWELDDLGGTAVLILDQFEEFLRHNRLRARDAMDFLVAMHQNLNIRVVLSYRAEYVHLIEDLDRDPRIGMRRHLKIDPISEEAISELLRTPRPPERPSPGWSWKSVIAPEVVDTIHGIWTRSARVEMGGIMSVGLLHLQALLYDLYAEAEHGRIEMSHLDSVVREALPSRRGAPLAPGAVNEPYWQCAKIMSFALEGSATLRIDLAQRAAEAAGMDPFAIQGISYHLARVVPRLSSGGYKLEQEASDLAEITLHDDIENIRELVEDAVASLAPDRPVAEGVDRDDEDLMESLIRALLAVFSAGAFAEVTDGSSPIASSRAAVIKAADQLLGWNSSVWERLLLDEDEYGLSAGPMMGLSPVATFIEQIRRFAWSLTWLSRLSIARVNAETDSSATVQLVHDGFGDALENWSDDYLKAHETWGLYALTTPEGESHDWEPERYADLLCGTLEQPRMHVNLGFKGNTVRSATLRHAVFVNCDFRGALFDECVFDSVTFLNCRLDGAVFSECTVHGSPGNEATSDAKAAVTVDDRLDVEWLRTPPVYLLQRDVAELAASMQRWRHESGSARFLLAQPPGHPAVPVDETGGGTEWEHATSGLLIQGSRIASLTFRQTKFVGDGVLAFTRARGSGLDLAEIQHAPGDSPPRVEFRRCLLRHVAFTTQEQDRLLELQVNVYDTVAAQWWVGFGFEGRLCAERSHVAQLWVESEDEFEAELLESCISTGTIGAKANGRSFPAVDSSRKAGIEVGTPQELDDLGNTAAVMDYRSAPDPLETQVSAKAKRAAKRAGGA